MFLFGFALGLWHALDFDHIAAMVTFAAARDVTPKRALTYGIVWATGHALMLLFMTVLIMQFHIELSARMASVMEFMVGAMLFMLALNMFHRLAAIRIHSHGHHHHDAPMHDHVHVHHHSEIHGREVHRHVHMVGEGHHFRALLVGLLHGLAGSAALVILVMSSVVSAAARMAYVLVFSAGAMIGMAALTLFVAHSVRRSTLHSPALAMSMRRCGAVFVLFMGLFLMSSFFVQT